LIGIWGSKVLFKVFFLLFYASLKKTHTYIYIGVAEIIIQILDHLHLSSLLSKVKLCTPGELLAACFLHCWTLPDGMASLFPCARMALLEVSKSFVKILQSCSPVETTTAFVDNLGHRDLIAAGYYDWLLCQLEEVSTVQKKRYGKNETHSF